MGLWKSLPPRVPDPLLRVGTPGDLEDKPKLKPLADVVDRLTLLCSPALDTGCALSGSVPIPWWDSARSAGQQGANWQRHAAAQELEESKWPADAGRCRHH